MAALRASAAVHRGEATIRRGLPSSSTVKSAALRPRTGRRSRVEHGDVELHGVDAGAERLRFHRRKLLRDRDGQQDRYPAGEQGEAIFQGNSPETLAAVIVSREASATATSLAPVIGQTTSTLSLRMP